MNPIFLEFMRHLAKVKYINNPLKDCDPLVYENNSELLENWYRKAIWFQQIATKSDILKKCWPIKVIENITRLLAFATYLISWLCFMNMYQKL